MIEICILAQEYNNFFWEFGFSFFLPLIDFRSLPHTLPLHSLPLRYFLQTHWVEEEQSAAHVEQPEKWDTGRRWAFQYCYNTWGRRVRIGFSHQVWRDQPRGHPEGAEGPEGCPWGWSRYIRSENPISTSKYESIGITFCVRIIIPRDGFIYARHTAGWFVYTVK